MDVSKKPTPRTAKLVGILIVLSIALGTLALSAYAQHMLVIKADQSFNADIAGIKQKITSSIEEYNGLLYAGRALITSSTKVTPEEWSNFYASQQAINITNGVSSIFFVEVVPSKEIASFETRMRKQPQFGANFKVSPAITTNDDYAVATLVHSNLDISPTYGFDYYSNTSQYLVLKRAAEINGPVASQSLVLPDGSPGFIVAIPVYGSNEKASGYVVMSLRTNEFTKNILKEQNKSIGIQIVDVTQAANPTKIYTFNQALLDKNELRYDTELVVGERTWEVSYASVRSYENPHLSRILPRLIMLCGGLVIAVLMVGYLWRKQH